MDSRKVEYPDVFSDPSYTGQRKSKKRRKKQIKKEKTRKKSLFFIIFLMTMSIYFGGSILKTQYKILKANQEMDRLQTKMETLQERQVDLLEQRENINDQEYMEMKARQELGLIKPGEKVLVITDSEENIPAK